MKEGDMNPHAHLINGAQTEGGIVVSDMEGIVIGLEVGNILGMVEMVFQFMELALDSTYIIQVFSILVELLGVLAIHPTKVCLPLILSKVFP